MTEKYEFDVADLSFELEGLPDGFTPTLTARPERTPGVLELELKVTSAEPIKPASTKLTWRVPMDRIHFKWNPACRESRFLDVTSSCKNSFSTRGIDSPPVASLYDIAGTNTLTFASSDAMHAGEMGIHVGEDGWLGCRVQIFCEAWDPITEYSVIVRIDRRPLPYYVCLRETAEWWDELIERPLAPVPEAARVPLYCTWYSQRRKLTLSDVAKRAMLAKDLGINVLLIDAGWGAYDARPTPETHAELFSLIRQVHDAGMKIMLWSSPTSTTKRATELFDGKVLVSAKSGKRRVDPRYPDVREHIIESYEQLLGECGVDGFKIDFISSIAPAAEDEADDDRRDYKSVSEGADRLLCDVADRLAAINPDVLLEYRQSYVGPHMLRHGNMFRAVDCANCFADNRIRTIDIRLLSGRMPPHADPIMWNTCESVESAAAQLTHTLFSVPQISVQYENLPADHTDMLRHYVQFWMAHRDVILDGELMPLDPQSAYPVVLSATAEKLLAAVYGRAYVPLPAEVPGVLLLVNGTFADHVVIEAAGALGKRQLTVLSCTGAEVCDREVDLAAGLHRIDIPPNGYATLSAT